MSKIYFVFLLGLFVAIMSLLDSFPVGAKKWLMVIVGIAIALTIVCIRRDFQALQRGNKASQINGGSFVESTRTDSDITPSSNKAGIK
jgi:O-antigen/teichoic acid export membrane protein